MKSSKMISFLNASPAQKCRWTSMDLLDLFVFFWSLKFGTSDLGMLKTHGCVKLRSRPWWKPLNREEPRRNHSDCWLALIIGFFFFKGKPLETPQIWWGNSPPKKKNTFFWYMSVRLEAATYCPSHIFIMHPLWYSMNMYVLYILYMQTPDLNPIQ